FGVVFFFSSRRRHTSFSRDWSSDVCSSDLRWVPSCPSATSPSSGGHVHREAESGLPRVGVLAHNNGQLHHAHSRGSVFTFSAPRSYHAPAGRIKTRTGPFLPAFATAGERQQLPPDPP